MRRVATTCIALNVLTLEDNHKIMQSLRQMSFHDLFKE